MPLVGFLEATDPKMISTVAAIQRDLTIDGLILRYRPQDTNVDGLPGGEGVFLACSFWLAEVLAMQGAHDQARELFERLLDLRNDVGLLAEEYDPLAHRQLGNFPQAFSHLALISAALVLGHHRSLRRPDTAHPTRPSANRHAQRGNRPDEADTPPARNPSTGS